MPKGEYTRPFTRSMKTLLRGSPKGSIGEFERRKMEARKSGEQSMEHNYSNPLSSTVARRKARAAKAKDRYGEGQ